MPKPDPAGGPDNRPDNSTVHRVLVTRPKHQALQFAKLLEDAGMQAILLPTIDIVLRDPNTLSDTEGTDFGRCDWCIFTSRNAVIGAKHCLLTQHLFPTTKVAAIGAATADSLRAHKIPVEFTPDKNLNSEKLLEALKDKIKTGHRVTIIRGDSGRDLLITELGHRGASVSVSEVYRRELPSISAAEVETIVEKALPCAISITSDQGLLNLLQLLPGHLHSQIKKCVLVVNSKRCAELARTHGFRNTIAIAEPPGDDGQLQALKSISW